ncbi:MAG: hypothetical protein JRF15_17365 [Deltaproteobacteria bacterium]|jgi:hypothetical protein|nr:hypothetical protein [Deltaproteobacteria bacterium]
MEFKTALVAGVLMPSIFLGASHADANGPAVSEPHPLVGASIEAIGRSGTDVQLLLADGAYYMPVEESFGLGLQLSAGLGLDEGDAKAAVAGGGTFFWRDPDFGYLGVEAFGLTFGSLDGWGVGAISGVYLGNWDLGGFAGFEGGDGEDGGVFGIDAGWYQSERLRFGIEGYAGTAEIYGGDASIQWQLFDATSNWVIGAYGGGGWFDGSGFYSAGIGVLYHFAAPKSLKRQLREDRL